jgi:hypothetical protein
MIEFFQLVGGGLPPQRADASALGQLPTRAFRYCEAVRNASSFGFYLYPPLDFRLMLDDGVTLFGLGADGDWWPLLDAAQYPGFAGRFDTIAPDIVKGYAPPWLGLTETPEMIQIWSGALIRTPADWSVLLRGPVNYRAPGHQNVEILEGIVETDTWFGPLFSNLRLLRSGIPVFFAAHRPLFQAIPIPRLALREFPVSIAELPALTKEDWIAYHHSVIAQNRHRPGAYAGAVRKRRAAEQSVGERK